ncbi:unnamed protein product [Calypogeia fissa]
MAKCMMILGLLVATLMVPTALGSDPDLTTDFNVTNPTVADFTFTGFRNPQPLGPGNAAPTPAAIPGLSGLGLTAVLFEFGATSQIDPHTHPRATELFYVTLGPLDVGFVDTANELFETTVQTGDIFVFPKGTLHWQRNNGAGTASGFSVLSSENPGTLLIAKALFTAGGKGLPDIVLSTAFNVGANNKEIDEIKEKVAQRNNVTLTLY